MNWRQRAWVWKAKTTEMFAKTIRFDLDSLFLTGKEIPYPLGITGGANFSGAYSSAGTVYSCIRRQAVDISNTPIMFLKNPDDPKTAAGDGHPLVKLFNNPGPGMTQSSIIELFVTYVLLRGDAFIATDTLASPTQLIAHFDPHRWTAMTVKEDGRENLAGWHYQESDDEMTRLPGDVIYHSLPSPYQRWRGQSPLAAASYAVMINRDGPKYHASVVSRGGERGITFKTPTVLSKDQYDQMRDRLRARRRGDGQSPEDIILEGGIDIIPPSFTAADIKILELLNPSKEDICEVFGMSPTLIGKANESNYSTFRGYLKIYWLQTLLPFIGKMQESFDRFTVKNYGLYTRWDLSKVDALQDYLDDKRQTATAFYRMGVPMRELNRRLNLQFDADKVIGADDVLVNLSMAPMSRIIAGDALDAQLARHEARQIPVENSVTRIATLDEALYAAAAPALSVPYTRRLAKISTRTKGVIRKALLEFKANPLSGEALRVPLQTCVDEARINGATLAIMAVSDTALEDAQLLAAQMSPSEGVLTDTLARDCLHRILDEVDPDVPPPDRARQYNAAINKVSAVINDLVQAAAGAGLYGRLQALGYLKEDQPCS